jgi:F-type H+-transporting ATPase subunit alpha
VKDALRAEQERLTAAVDAYRYRVARREEGRVLAIADGVATVSGLGGARLDELLRVGDAVDALAMSLEPRGVRAVVLGETAAARVGAPVRATGRVASVPVGEGLLGRVIDPLGRPLDGLGPVPATERWPVERPAPPIWARAPVAEPLLTGLLVVDALFPIGRGQRQLVLGDRGTGKSTLAADTLIHQRGAGVVSVYVSIGQMGSSVVSLVETLRAAGALERTTVVIAEADASPGLRFLAPYAGCAIAEWFRDHGDDALVVYDDLEAHAVAYRELALLMRRPPGREAYPGDVFFLHARLLERATRLTPERGGGSLTALPITETRVGRISDYIPTNLISITDGQLFLDAHLFDRGIKPAVSIGTSVSRVGAKTQRPSMKAVAGRLRLDTARFEELEVFTRFGARLEPSTKQILIRGERARELAKQAPASPLEHGEQVALLLALEMGLFDARPPQEVSTTARALLERLAARAPRILADLEAGRPPGSEARAAVREAAW